MTSSAQFGSALPIRYPAPLRAGDLIAVTAPSAGVSPAMRPRLEFCVADLHRRGLEVVIGRCMDGERTTSAPPALRAAELMTYLTDPKVRAVVPPWGGEMAIDLLDLLDFDAIAAAEPTWLVGYSDISTIMTPLTLRTGIATAHAPNLMDTPMHSPAALEHWLDVLSSPTGSTIVQGPAPLHQGERWPNYSGEPRVSEWPLSEPASWKLLDETLPNQDQPGVSGRLIGGCLETMSMLPGTPYGDLNRFATRCAPEGLLVYLEVAEANAHSAARMLHHLRLAGWFEAANGVLIGRAAGPDVAGYSQLDALHDALDRLTVPIFYDLDFGHVPAQLTLINGALTTIELGPAGVRLTQRLT